MNARVFVALAAAALVALASGCAAPEEEKEARGSHSLATYPSKCLGTNICDKSGNPNGPGSECRGTDCDLPRAADDEPPVTNASYEEDRYDDEGKGDDYEDEDDDDYEDDGNYEDDGDYEGDGDDYDYDEA
ncbi:MAG: hypothetical protein KIT84_08190 [Labilithrix sp.]|nr:hypothetical protein [Labilithrix sp.]MCW5810976.1 hypothetical protein [Labilithrix sp.]